MKTTVLQKLLNRKHARLKKMYGNPLTNVYGRMRKTRSRSRAIKEMTRKYKKTDLISQMYAKLGKRDPLAEQKQYWK
jgi:hypothetical protein